MTTKQSEISKYYNMLTEEDIRFKLYYIPLNPEDPEVDSASVKEIVTTHSLNNMHDEEYSTEGGRFDITDGDLPSLRCILEVSSSEEEKKILERITSRPTGPKLNLTN